jgi:hypothetical protein
MKATSWFFGKLFVPSAMICVSKDEFRFSRTLMFDRRAASLAFWRKSWND